VTLRARVSELRDFPVSDAVEAALAKGSKKFFRVCEYSVQRNHIHLIVEADDTVALSRGMQGLVARIAKAVNRTMHRKGANRGIDGCSSANWFTGWTDHRPDHRPDIPPPLPAATEWLLNVGWRRRGLISTSEAPRAQYMFD